MTTKHRARLRHVICGANTAAAGVRQRVIAASGELYKREGYKPISGFPYELMINPTSRPTLRPLMS